MSEWPIWEEYKNTRVLREDIVKAFRKNQSWDQLSPELQERVGSSDYEKLKDYFTLTGLVDFIKPWQLDFHSAYERSIEIQKLIGQLENVRNNLEEVRGNVAVGSVEGLKAFLVHRLGR